MGNVKFYYAIIALAAFAAASVANVSPCVPVLRQCAWGNHLLRAVFFVFNPASLQGSLPENLQALSPRWLEWRWCRCPAGLSDRVGDLGRGAAAVVRLLTGISGLTLALPAGGLFGFSQLLLLLVAAVALIAAVVLHRFAAGAVHSVKGLAGPLSE